MNYYLKKSLVFLATLLCVAILTFLIFRLIPGSAAVSRLGTEATEEQIEEINRQYGYDKSLPQQFFSWISGVVRGDFGESARYSPMRVSELIGKRLPITVGLALIAIFLIAGISIPLGLWCSKNPGGLADRVSDAVTQVFMSVPSFIQGILITLVFGIVLHWFTPGEYVSMSESFGGYILCLFFPALAVALPKIAMTVKFMKSSVKRELQNDYVRTARAKGNTKSEVMWKHVFKNSLLPVITFFGMIVAEVMAGSIMVEQVFNLPGIGTLLVSSISTRDFNVVAAIVMYIAVIVIAANFIVDIAYRLVDPRTGEN